MDNVDEQYEAIEFNNAVPFINGDQIFYQPSDVPYVGLETGTYFVGILTTSTTNRKIRLYHSRALINDIDFIKLKNSPGTHTFTLSSQTSPVIGPQKLLKKFPLESTSNRGNQTETKPGTTGMLINGVEITNYKSNDKIYYGPLKSVDILNGGVDSLYLM